MVKEPRVKPLISVIIPCLHEAQTIGKLLDHVRSLPRLHDGPMDIVVVDGAPEGDTLAAVDPIKAQPLVSLPGRARQMNAGAAQARADTLLFLHADTRLPADAFTALVQAMEKGAVGGAFDLDIDSERPVIRLIALVGRWRARLTRIPFGDQAIFVSRQAFEAVGGFEDVPIMEDVRFMRALKRQGRVTVLRQRVLTSARRWEAEGPVHRTLCNWWLRLLHGLGVPPKRLARLYRPQAGPQAEAVTAVQALMVLRSPERGRVKTRLAAGVGPGDIGQHAALALYKAFVADELDALAAFGHDEAGLPVTVFAHPPEAVETCRKWLDRPCLPQQGADLGERMAGAFRWAFDKGAQAALLVGGDLPELSREHLDAALAALNETGTALAPSGDGGYSLIAFTRRAFTPEAFRNVDWGTPRVLEQTLAGLDAAGRRVRLLPELPDVDTIDDLAALAERWRGRDGGPARTLAVLRELRLFREK